MAAQNFPFVFDAEKLKELFSAAKLPGVDADAVLAAQQKNGDAMNEANQVVIAGYQDLYQRPHAPSEAAVAPAQGQQTEAQSQPRTADQATQNVEALKAAFEKAAADAKEHAELVQNTNTDAFEIVKARFEEAVAEFKAAAEKIAT